MTRDGEMWFCPGCEKWSGSKLEECLCGTPRPRWEVRTGDVDPSAAGSPNSYIVARASPLARLWWRVRGRLRARGLVEDGGRHE